MEDFENKKQDLSKSNNTDNEWKITNDNDNPLVEKQIDKILNSTDFSLLHLRFYVIKGLFLLSFGCQMIIVSLLLDTLEKEWKLNSFQKGFLGGSVFLGIFIGSIFSGKLSDRYGRKRLFLFGLVICSIFGILSGLIVNFNNFIICRCCFGIGIGISLISINALTVEISSTKYRGWIINIVWLFFPFGEIIGVIESEYLLNINKNGWRYVLLVASFPFFVIFLSSVFIYESPRFSLSTQNYCEAFKTLDSFLISKKMNCLNENDRKIIIEQNKLINEKYKYQTYFTEIFKSEFIRVTLLCCGIFFIGSFIYYGIIYITPQELKGINGNGLIYKSMIYASLTEIPSSILASIMVNSKYLGRLKTMNIGFLFSIIQCFFCLCDDKNKSIYLIFLRFSINLPILSNKIFVFEAFPTNIRGISFGFCYSFSRIGAIFSLLINQVSLQSNYHIPFINLIIGSVLGFIFSIFLPFETNGKPII